MWILIASLPPFLWALNNIADEYMAKHHFAKSGALLILLSTSFEIIPALLGHGFNEAARIVVWTDGLVMAAMGFWLSLAFIPYIFAIQCSNASNVLPIYKLIPVFVFFLGWFFLGETATAQQVIGALLLIISSVAISWDYHHSRLDSKPFGLMALSSLMISFYVLGLRYYSQTYDPIVVNIWLWTGSGIGGLICVLAYGKWRRESMDVFRTSDAILLGVFFFQIVSQLCASWLWTEGMAIAPSAALMEAMGGIHPAYLLFLSLLAGRSFPNHFHVIAVDRVFYIKLSLIGLMLIGVYLISL